MGGRQIELPRLRVHGPEGEVALASFQWASSTDAMDAYAMQVAAAGVSTRRYRGTLDPVAMREPYMMSHERQMGAPT